MKIMHVEKIKELRAPPANYLSLIFYIFSLFITNNIFYIFSSNCCSRLLKG